MEAGKGSCTMTQLILHYKEETKIGKDSKSLITTLVEVKRSCFTSTISSLHYQHWIYNKAHYKKFLRLITYRGLQMNSIINFKINSGRGRKSKVTLLTKRWSSIFP